jgi:hypothetical protein
MKFTVAGGQRQKAIAGEKEIMPPATTCGGEMSHGGVFRPEPRSAPVPGRSHVNLRVL